ncbi:hypothetical protein LDENG_00094440 [Lucifuga dentata]|nr:hypothetical protein LDENG_00094440 [Lucifuga dentata]
MFQYIGTLTLIISNTLCFYSGFCLFLCAFGFRLASPVTLLPLTQLVQLSLIHTYIVCHTDKYATSHTH